MFYLILTVNLVILALLAAFVVRFIRAPKEKRSEMFGFLQNRRAIIVLVSGFIAFTLIGGGAFFFLVGTTGIRAGSAAKDYLREKFGASQTWELSLGDHTERSKKPAAGTYEVEYRYDKKSGVLLVEYSEIDGKLAFKVTPKEK